MKSVTVVGASLAGLSSARALREQGFDGTITLVGDEIHRPYDRPPLSKSFLKGIDDGLSLETSDDEALDLQWRLGVRATGLSAGEVLLADGSCVRSDAVVIATGASAIRLFDDTAGVHVLRSLDDALALRQELVPGARVAVIGAGFIGSEVASTAVELGCSVTVLEASPAPLERVFGAHIGSLVAAWHGRGGATLMTGAPVSGLTSLGSRVTAVEFADGTTVPADVVVVGIGSRPNIEWLAGSGIALAGGVVTDRRGLSSIPGVVAVGDCAAVRDPSTGITVRDEHWTAAATRPTVAMKSLLSGGESVEVFTGVPYVWSDQYQSRIQFAGHQGPECLSDIVEGDPTVGPFVAVYRRAGQPVAVLAVSSPRAFGKWRRQLVT
ncbi:FAD-dependent oxidoreductase [Rhodococcus sp. G-MC3]|uniref:NAD(P)/FAD-dependent oxidoreductase n=1 Tax=Rhodococcus sp. G-MC3 TaxID=3046209 RepID=UPI0024BA3542|nr:FAD-dependent oxidoreductase [Rhodococcus sp. G-MC3]MDJ0394392.1 FAD-dependent oxidoreductase [Rhodococcus sp. G-MC3]